MMSDMSGKSTEYPQNRSMLIAFGISIVLVSLWNAASATDVAMLALEALSGVTDFGQRITLLLVGVSAVEFGFIIWHLVFVYALFRRQNGFSSKFLAFSVIRLLYILASPILISVVADTHLDVSGYVQDTLRAIPVAFWALYVASWKSLLVYEQPLPTTHGWISEKSQSEASKSEGLGQAQSKIDDVGDEAWDDEDPWHEILKVPPEATIEEITKAYKALMSKYHPDKFASLGDDLKDLAETMSKRITMAYREAKRLHGIV